MHLLIAQGKDFTSELDSVSRSDQMIPTSNACTKVLLTSNVNLKGDVMKLIFRVHQVESLRGRNSTGIGRVVVTSSD